MILNRWPLCDDVPCVNCVGNARWQTLWNCLEMLRILNSHNQLANLSVSKDDQFKCSQLNECIVYMVGGIIHDGHIQPRAQQQHLPKKSNSLQKLLVICRTNQNTIQKQVISSRSERNLCTHNTALHSADHS